MLKIESNIKPIEFEINGMIFTVYKTDEILHKLDKIEKNLKEKGIQVEKEDSIESLNTLRRASIEAYDTLLGEGTFNKIEDSLSEVKGEYTFQMVNIFFKIYEHVTNETVEELDLTRYDKADIKSN